MGRGGVVNEPSGEVKYVGRGGLKLHHALREFSIDVNGLACADFGCNVGGFTDCLLRHGAAHVYAVDTGYGALDWKLRNDPRVTVMERTNALHATPPTDRAVGLIVIDMGWTTQDKCMPAAMKWLSGAGDRGRVISLVKPHYEAKRFGMDHLLREGVLDEADAEYVLERVLADLPARGVRVMGVTRSPIVGGETKGNRRGNVEWLALLAAGA